MDCNNTLTDAQLETMFSMADEEMQQIEQPMKCPMERTQHKCKKCDRIFCNEAALRHHHCEPPIKKKKFPHCGKAISRANNLEKYVRSYEKVPTYPAKR